MNDTILDENKRSWIDSEVNSFMLLLKYEKYDLEGIVNDFWNY